VLFRAASKARFNAAFDLGKKKKKKKTKQRKKEKKIYEMKEKNANKLITSESSTT
jgi:hypothetical protein